MSTFQFVYNNNNIVYLLQNKHMNKQILRSLFPTGAFIITIASLLQIFTELGFIAYLYSIGAIVLILYHAFMAFDNVNVSALTTRQYRIGFFASLFLGLASYFLFVESNSWGVMTLIYAVITFYLSFRIKE